MHVSPWTYALVAPFPTLIDDVASQELLAAWSGGDFGPFVGIPLLMEQSTLATFTRLWGSPAEGAVQVVAGRSIAGYCMESNAFVGDHSV